MYNQKHEKHFLIGKIYKDVISWWLTGILLFLPFQRKIVEIIKPSSKALSSFIAYLDEITTLIFLLLAIREFYKKREIPNKLSLILLLPILVFSISGFISGLLNKNSLLITALGTFDYIKNFLVIFIYAAFFREFDDFKKIFRFLLILTVFLGLIALIQELWATGFRYILREDVKNIKYLLTHELQPALAWRFGIYKAPSLTHNSNIFGLYSLLILSIYLFTVNKINFAVLASLFAGIFASVSRMAYAGFAFVGGVQIFNGKKWFILLLFPVVICLFYISFFSGSDIEEVKFIDATKDFEAKSYRAYTRGKAVKIWQDHPLLGVGPGMYGGVISIKYQSPIYDKYNFQGMIKEYLETFKGIDQFWPQILAEVGIVGFACFIWLFVLLAIMLFILRRKTFSHEIKGLYTGLLTYIIVILIYTWGSGLNITENLFTYSAFVGIGLGCGTKK